MFRGRFAMNDPCPVCEMIFQREEGYFLGAMYASYLLSVAMVLPLYLLAALVLPDAYNLLAVPVTFVMYLPLVPAVFRYSRVLWIYFDRSMCPADVSAGPIEKVMQQQIDAGTSDAIGKT